MVKPPASRAAELDRATRRAQVIAALADTVATIDRAPPLRVAVAARHGRQVRDNDLLAERTLRRLLDQTGWLLDRYDDPPDRFLAIATRTDQPVAATRPERHPAGRPAPGAPGAAGAS